MITLKCKHCDASLKRVGRVLWDADPGTADPWITECTMHDGPHVAVRLLQFSFSGTLSIDVDAWVLAFGVADSEVADDARLGLLTHLQAMITDERMVRDVSVKGA